MTIDLIIRGGTVVSHRGVEQGDIAVRDGIVVAIGDLTNVASGKEIDASGLHVLPGVIDTEFYRNPEFDNETRAALRGGVTSVLTISQNDAVGDAYCNHAFFTPITADDIENVAEIENADGCAGLYLSMTVANGFDAITEDRDILSVLKKARRRVMVQAEDHKIVEAKKSLIEAGNPASSLNWRSEKAYVEGLRRILAIARGAGTPVHVQHLSCANEMAMIAAYKDIATASMSPYHLLLSAPDCYDHFHNFIALDPPVRGEENRHALWKGLSNGIVDVLASGHKPVSVVSKEVPYPNCVSGAPAAQTMMPLMLDQVAKGSLSLQTLMDMTSAGPARVYNIASKGRIAVGYDADFTVIDLNKVWMLEDDDVESTCGWDLYAGAEFTGQVTGTVINGEMAMWDGEIIGGPKGRPVRFYDNFEEYPDAL